MSVQRFLGSTNRDAMQRVRNALGEDALVLANRATENGVEILAMTERDADRLAEDGQAVSAPGRIVVPRTGLPRKASPLREMLWRRLRVAGFSAAFSEPLLARMPARADRIWLADCLQAALQVPEPDSLLKSRVLILLGPTGVGKTLTAVKLAARHAARHGTGGVALVGTDIYRTGAMVQLRGHADRLGVDLHTMEADLDVADVVEGLAHKQLIIVDAPGFGPRDKRLVEQVRWLCAGVAARPVLILEAARNPEALDDAIVQYRRVVEAAGLRLEDAIVSKQDEASRMGPVLESLIRHEMRLHFLSGGQHVQRDLNPADAGALVAEALLAPAREVHAEAIPEVHRIVRQGRAMGDALASLSRHAPEHARIRRLWAWRALPEAVQARHLQSDRVPASAQGATCRLWQGGAEACVYGLDEAGLPLPDDLHAWSRSELAEALSKQPENGVRTQLFMTLPGTEAWRTLVATSQHWACRARPGQQVLHAGKRWPLRACRGLAGTVDAVPLRWRGRSCQALLRRLPVATSLPGGKVSALFTAWFVDLRLADTGALLAQPCFLVPAATTDAQARGLVLALLGVLAWPAMVKRAFERLTVQADALPGPACMALARTMAALAMRLDACSAEWALDLRVQLRNMAGTARTAGAAGLVDRLVDLLMACDSLQHLCPPASVPVEA